MLHFLKIMLQSIRNMKNKVFLGCCLVLSLLPGWSLATDIAHPIQSCWYQGNMAAYNLTYPWTPEKNTPDAFVHSFSSAQYNLLGKVTAEDKPDESPKGSLMMQAYNSKQLSLSSIALGVQMSVKFH